MKEEKNHRGFWQQLSQIPSDASFRFILAMHPEGSVVSPGGDPQPRHYTAALKIDGGMKVVGIGTTIDIAIEDLIEKVGGKNLERIGQESISKRIRSAYSEDDTPGSIFSSFVYEGELDETEAPPDETSPS